MIKRKEEYIYIHIVTFIKLTRLDKIKNVNALQENIGFIIINKKYKIPFIDLYTWIWSIIHI